MAGPIGATRGILGLDVRSQICIAGAENNETPGLEVTRVSAHECEVPAQSLCDLAWLGIEGRVWQAGWYGPAGPQLVFPRVGCAHFTSGRVEVAPHPDADPEMLGPLLSGPILSLAALLHGRPPLHASCVAFDGVAVAVVAASGGGKSTIAAALCASGGLLITDDTLVVDVEDESLRCRLGPGEIRLRPGAAIGPDRFGSEGTTSADGRLLARPVLAADRTPLGAVVVPVLAATASGGFDRRRLRPAEATAALVARPRLLAIVDPRLRRLVFEHCVTVATRVPMYEVMIPWMDRLSPEIERELVDLCSDVLHRS